MKGDKTSIECNTISKVMCFSKFPMEICKPPRLMHVEICLTNWNNLGLLIAREHVFSQYLACMWWDLIYSSNTQKVSWPVNWMKSRLYNTMKRSLNQYIYIHKLYGLLKRGQQSIWLGSIGLWQLIIPSDGI